MVGLAVGITASMEHIHVRFVTYSISYSHLADSLPRIPAVLRSVSPTGAFGTPPGPLDSGCLICRSHLQELGAVPELI